MFTFIPWRPLKAIFWDAFQSVWHTIRHIRLRPQQLPPNGVPVFIMLPLDTALPTPQIPPDIFHAYLKRLASLGVHGVMVDVWWRVCEPSAGRYDFSRYIALAKTCRSLSLKLQAVLSFHGCGGNIGDSVNIPLPDWVVAAGDQHHFWFSDRAGNVNREYISFGADYEPVLPMPPDERGRPVRPRTPLQAYAAFTKKFVAAMEDEGLMGVTVTELQVGLGPCGELRYPSYPLSRWTFPGIGEFQCFDKYLLRELAATVREKGSDVVKAATMPPDGTGRYNDTPFDTAFFTGGMRTEPGRFFLQWYADRLLEHGEDVLRQVRDVVPKADRGVAIAVKISGVHWWKHCRSRAAEATCGYIGGDGQPMYRDIAKLLRAKGAVLDFTCLEMRTIDQPMRARCGPRQLVAEVFQCARNENVAVAGENALQTFEKKAFGQIVYSFRCCDAQKAGFTLLRLCDDLMMSANLKRLEGFVKDMRRIDAIGRL